MTNPKRENKKTPEYVQRFISNSGMPLNTQLNVIIRIELAKRQALNPKTTAWQFNYIAKELNRDKSTFSKSLKRNSENFLYRVIKYIQRTDKRLSKSAA